MAPSGMFQSGLSAVPPSLAHSFLYSIFAALIRCTQNEHFSITPRLRTVTSGFICMRRHSSGPPEV